MHIEFDETSIVNIVKGSPTDHCLKTKFYTVIQKKSQNNVKWEVAGKTEDGGVVKAFKSIDLNSKPTNISYDHKFNNTYRLLVLETEEWFNGETEFKYEF